MLSAWGIRKFLIRAPKPRLIKLTTGTKVEEIRPSHNQSFSKLGETIAAVMPELIQCFDAEGTLIRAVRPQIEHESNDAPKTPELLAQDPETARLTHFANLLHRAYEHSTNVAFTKMVELVERIDARSDNLEARLERTELAHRRVLQRQIDDAFDRADELAEEAGGEGSAMIKSFLEGMAQRVGDVEERPRRTNGKGQQ
jgi:thioredoxin-like negative regulator of GroEL